MYSAKSFEICLLLLQDSSLLTAVSYVKVVKILSFKGNFSVNGITDFRNFCYLAYWYLISLITYNDTRTQIVRFVKDDCRKSPSYYTD
jgi:hypothetical protein